MAINISICQENNCAELVINDISTSLYDDGTVEINSTAVTEATVSIEDADGNSDSFNVLSVFTGATTQDDLSFNISTLYDETFADGAYTIVYTIVADTTYTITKSVYLYCTIECCVTKMIATIPNYYNCNKCNSKEILNALTAESLLLSLKNSAGCGDVASTEKIYALLDKVCTFKNCNCV